MADLPSPVELCAMFDYDPESGILYWRSRDRNLSGLAAGGSASPDGYVRVRVRGRLQLAHRVILAMHNGAWPDGQVDHINGNRSDNRLCNLRAVPRSENLKNKARYSSNRSGVSGVHWHRQHGKWCAAVQDGGRRHHLGLFSDISSAAAAVSEARQRLGFHDNHGRN